MTNPQDVTRLAQATMVALMGISDMKQDLLKNYNETVPVGRVLKMLDTLQLEIIKCREGEKE